jgi:hypothetical protein
LAIGMRRSRPRRPTSALDRALPPPLLARLSATIAAQIAVAPIAAAAVVAAAAAATSPPS